MRSWGDVNKYKDWGYWRIYWKQGEIREPSEAVNEILLQF